MKTLICFLLITSNAWAKSVDEFNKSILQDVTKDIQKDEEKFKKSAPSRGPASVNPVKMRKFPGPEKIEKNVKQIGPNDW